MAAKSSEHEQPEVAALKKKIRGEPLTEEETALLANATRKPAAGAVTFSQEQVSALLAERARRGEGFAGRRKRFSSC
jgi:hypothetical protein